MFEGSIPFFSWSTAAQSSFQPKWAALLKGPSKYLLEIDTRQNRLQCDRTE